MKSGKKNFRNDREIMRRNRRKNGFLCIACLFATLITFISGYRFESEKTLAEGVNVTNIDNVYGITYANIDTFGYYEYSTGQFGYNEYGAGMDIKFKLPKEAKEGDYFTLNYGDQLMINKMPMYGDNEEVPYASLDSQPNRYNNRHDNIFFVVKTRGDAQNPYGVPLLNVYYTKKGELTFVVQKYANDKGVIEGDAIIGETMNDPFNANSSLNSRFEAITDGNGRHVRKGKKQWPWDVEDLEYQLSKYYFFTGFRPNNLLMRVQAGAELMNNHRAFIGRDITYVSKYMNANPVELNDANGNPDKSGMFVNYETELFKWWGGGNVTSFGKEHLYPHYEDREYIYYHFIYQANKGATDSTAGRNVKIYPIDNTLDIEEIKLYKGFDSNGSVDYSSLSPNSIVPPMAYFDTGQTVQGLAFAKQNDGSWYANFNWHQHQTYFGVLKARKKNPSKFEGKDAYKIGMWSYTGTKQRTHDDYYIPTSGFGYGLADTITPKDSIGFFKIRKADPNNNVVKPVYELKDGKMQYIDTYGNTFTYDESKKAYVNQYGRAVSQVKDKDGNLIFEDNLLNKYTQIVNGSEVTYKDEKGEIYTKVSGKDEWRSQSGKIFKPTRPLLLEDSFTLRIIDNGNDTSVTDADGNPLTKIEMIDKDNFSVITRYGNILMVKKENGERVFYKWDGATKQFVRAEHVLQQQDSYHITNLGYNPTHIRPLLKKTFVFRMTDKDINNVFEHGIDEYGYVVFPSLLEGHKYKLEEVSAGSGYIKTDKTFNVDVKSKNNVVITDSDGNLVTKNSVPMSIVDSENLLYTVVNDTVGFAISKRIKGIESTGRHITSEMEFKLSKINDNTFEPQIIKQKANENFVFTGLTKGEYILEETQPPSGYVADRLIYKVIADDDGNIHIFKLPASNANHTYVESQRTLIKDSLLSQNVGDSSDGYAIDGNVNTSAIWHQTDPGNTLGGPGSGDYGNNNIRVGTYIGIDLGAPKLIHEVTFMQGQENNHNDRMSSFDMEYSVDNVKWKTYKSYSEASTNQGDVSEKNMTLYARYIRFVNKEPVLSKWFSVKEINAKIYENIGKTITAKMQKNLTSEENIAFIGNIQNPKLVLEKLDMSGNKITGTAKFKLYKVDEDTTEGNIATKINEANLIHEISITDGTSTVIDPFNAKTLGKYALVETEAPNGYVKLSKPTLLELYEDKQSHDGTLNKAVTRFKVLNNNEKVVVDTSDTVNTNRMYIKIKNEKVKTNISIQKLSKLTDKTLLGVKLKLSSKDSDKKPQFSDLDWHQANYEGVVLENENALTWKTSNAGDAVFSLDDGVYKVEELEAPNGYNKIKPFEFTLSNGKITLSDGVDGEEVKVTSKDNRLSIQMINFTNQEYPGTGGIGSLIFTVIGISIMSIAILIFKRQQSRYS